MKFKKIESRVGYEIVRKIGRGSFANVYLAIRRGYGLDRYVALKIIDMSSMDERNRMVIMEEAKILGKLSHPNIIHIYDCGMVDDDTFFIVVELVNGFSLKEVISEHTKKVMNTLGDHEQIPLSLMKHTAASVLIHTANGLNYMHNAHDLLTGDPLHIIHNDLKPGNILIGLNGTLKVSDFGISYSTVRTVKLKGGSPAYMAPEWIQMVLSDKPPQKPDPTVDIYSLGVCLHETLTDRRLFKAPKPNMPRKEMLKAIYSQMKNHKRGTTLKINPAADPKLCKIADRCLQFDPENRYQSMSEIIGKVDKYISDGRYHPEILDRRFLSEYMGSLYPGGEISRFMEQLNESSVSK